MTKAISFSVVFEALKEHKGWNDGSIQDVINYKEFENILAFKAQVTSVKRTISEKWKMLIEHGFLKKVNQSETHVINVSMIRDHINTPKTKRLTSIIKNAEIEEDA